jgi:hypothetical protein
MVGVSAIFIQSLSQSGHEPDETGRLDHRTNQHQGGILLTAHRRADISVTYVLHDAP